MVFKFLAPYLILITLLYSVQSFSQNPDKSIFIETNINANVSLIFPSAIKETVITSPKYKFTFNHNSNLGILQAREGDNAYMTVITATGEVYSLEVGYNKAAKTSVHIIDKASAIASVNSTDTSTEIKPDNIPEPKPVVKDNTSLNSEDIIQNKAPSLSKENASQITNKNIDPLPDDKDVPENTITENIDTETGTDISADWFEDGDKEVIIDEQNFEENPFIEEDLYVVNKEQYFEIYCENNILQSSFFKRFFKEEGDVRLRFKNIFKDRNEIYLILQVENLSERDYNINFLDFYIEHEKSKNKKRLEPVFKYNFQDVVLSKTMHEMVFVFDEFKLDSKERLLIVLDEIDGLNLIVFPVQNSIINDPRI